MSEYQPGNKEVETSVYKRQGDDFNSMRLRLDPTPILEHLRHSLRREYYDERQEAWVNPKQLPPMLSYRGVEDLMLDLTSRMSVDKALANIKNTEYNLILREIGEAVLGFLFFNAKEYEIQEADIDRIFHIVMHNVRLFLSRSRGGFENIGLRGQLKYTETKTLREDAQQQQKSGYNFFGGRGQ